MFVTRFLFVWISIIATVIVAMVIVFVIIIIIIIIIIISIIIIIAGIIMSLDVIAPIVAIFLLFSFPIVPQQVPTLSSITSSSKLVLIESVFDPVARVHCAV